MTESRRGFIKKSIHGGIGLTLASPLLSGLWAAPTEIPPIGIITNTVRDEMKSRPEETLKLLAETGYRFIESGTNGFPVKKYKKWINEAGLSAPVGGSSMYPLLEDLDKELKISEALDRKYIICYWPWLDGGENLTRDTFMEAAENLNAIGKKCKEAGFKFALHNHDKEFQLFDDLTGYDLILQNTDPDYLDMEMDLYWVCKANEDPVHYMDKYPERIKLFHIKDMDDTRARTRLCPGDGVIDFQRIFDKAKEIDVAYYIVENEVAPEGTQINCMRNSFTYLKSLHY
jgi:sugar phosphate isomerase/epimerase